MLDYGWIGREDGMGVVTERTQERVLTEGWNDRDNIYGPSSKIDSMPVPVNMFWSAFVQIWNLPGLLSNDPVIKNEDRSHHGSEDYLLLKTCQAKWVSRRLTSKT